MTIFEFMNELVSAVKVQMGWANYYRIKEGGLKVETMEVEDYLRSVPGLVFTLQGTPGTPGWVKAIREVDIYDFFG